MTSNTDQAQRATHGRILVADDEHKNRELLRDLLELEGHAVIEAENGMVALEKAESEACDVILLDVMMPQMDGLEACRQLKQNPKTTHLPVLIVSALSEQEQRLQGVAAGANDYLTKPIDRRDVLFRVRNALYAKRLYDQGQEDLAKLRELEILRDNLTNMIVHDMRSPLTGITGYLEMLEMSAGEKLDSNDLAMLRSAKSSGLVLVGMVNSLLDISRLEAGKMPLDIKKSDIDVLIQEALNSLGSLTRKASLLYQKQAIPVMVNCDTALVTRVIANLVGNAIKFTPEGSTVTVSVERNGDKAKLNVADTGRGIPREYHKKIFEKFWQVEIRQKKISSTGLGLTFCKLAVEAHGGEMGLKSEVDKGSTFWFTLPAPQDNG
jgi:signal transduction histidine kinase